MKYVNIALILCSLGLVQNAYSQKTFLKENLSETQKLIERVGDRKITVHINPHSHDDVGWVKTVDQYFSGSNQYVTKGNVNMTITSVIEELEKDPQKTFSFVEMKFFTMWWKYQTDDKKNSVR